MSVSDKDLVGWLGQATKEKIRTCIAWEEPALQLVRARDWRWMVMCILGTGPTPTCMKAV